MSLCGWSSRSSREIWGRCFWQGRISNQIRTFILQTSLGSIWLVTICVRSALSELVLDSGLDLCWGLSRSCPGWSMCARRRSISPRMARRPMWPSAKGTWGRWSTLSCPATPFTRWLRTAYTGHLYKSDISNIVNCFLNEDISTAFKNIQEVKTLKKGFSLQDILS